MATNEYIYIHSCIEKKIDANCFASVEPGKAGELFRPKNKKKVFVKKKERSFFKNVKKTEVASSKKSFPK